MFTSCKKEEEEPATAAISCTDVTGIAAAAKKVLDASVAYENDKSVANCNTYKSALNSYITGLESCTLYASTVKLYKGYITELKCK